MFTLLMADIGTAAHVPSTDDFMQFGGRQSVYANGDTIAFCYAKGYGSLPNNMTTVVYKYSDNGGRTFSTLFNRVVEHLDGMPTLTKKGQEVIITYSSEGFIKRYISYNNGTSFTNHDEVIGSDKLPITEKEHNTYRTCYTYQCFDPDSWYNDGLLSTTSGNFTENIKSTNNTPVYYNGTDVVEGTLRSGNSIWIKQEGGGTNNGWPTFKGMVITSSVINSYSGIPPFAQVFRGGYIEHAPEVEFDEVSAYQQIATQAEIVGSTMPEPDKITILTVSGTSYTTMIGQIVTTGFDTLWVYSDYPPGNGAPLFANIIPHVDTLWTQGPSGVTTGNTKFMVNTPLWIRGTFSGTQLWYSPFDIYLMDDILLTGTPVGQEPDGTYDIEHYNHTDKVAIVSGKSIYIQYGYKDPLTNVRMYPNSGPDTGSIWIYASLYALGNGNGNSHEDGVFTFQYQHPHPSIPDLQLSTPTPNLYDKIDLHRRVYPQTTQNPWPSNIDYPYYNPLWPEGNPYMERGTLTIYGNVVQRRSGFMHRNRLDAEYPNPLGEWNVGIDFCGGASGNAYTDPVLGITYQPVNATGSVGQGVGYKKSVHNDFRIRRETFGFNPWNFGIRMDSGTQIGQWQNDAFRVANFDMISKAYDRKYGKTVLGINSKLYHYNNTSLADISSYIPANGNVTQLNLLNENQALVYLHDRHNGMHGTSIVADTLHVFSVNLNDGAVSPICDSAVPSEMNDFTILGNGLKVFAKTNAQNEVQLYAINQNFALTPLYTWNPGLAELASEDYEFSKAKLHLVPAGNDSLYIFIWIPAAYPNPPWSLVATNGKLFMARGSFANTAIPEGNEVPVPVQKLTLSSYPNPFKDSSTITVGLAKNAQVSVSIYNIKGELIKSLVQADKKAGTFQLSWDGKDTKGKAVSAGVYFYKCTADKKEVMSKVVLIK
jgi:hypothetical protein